MIHTKDAFPVLHSDEGYISPIIPSRQRPGSIDIYGEPVVLDPTPLASVPAIAQASGRPEFSSTIIQGDGEDINSCPSNDTHKFQS